MQTPAKVLAHLETNKDAHLAQLQELGGRTFAQGYGSACSGRYNSCGIAGHFHSRNSLTNQ